MNKNLATEAVQFYRMLDLLWRQETRSEVLSEMPDVVSAIAAGLGDRLLLRQLQRLRKISVSQ
jgi:hypothetical protein